MNYVTFLFEYRCLLLVSYLVDIVKPLEYKALFNIVKLALQLWFGGYVKTEQYILPLAFNTDYRDENYMIVESEALPSVWLT